MAGEGSMTLITQSQNGPCLAMVYPRHIRSLNNMSILQSLRNLHAEEKQNRSSKPAYLSNCTLNSPSVCHHRMSICLSPINTGDEHPTATSANKSTWSVFPIATSLCVTGMLLEAAMNAVIFDRSTIQDVRGAVR